MLLDREECPYDATPAALKALFEALQAGTVHVDQILPELSPDFLQFSFTWDKKEASTRCGD